MRTTPVLPAMLLGAVLALGLAGCAKRVPELPPRSPEAVWQSFREAYGTPPAEPALSLTASFLYTRIQPMRRTNRTLVTLWGDFDGPMRLDLAAGIGRMLAHIREDGDGLLVYYPDDTTAYAHADPVLGATRLGMPFPFSLSELASVLAGDFSGLVPASYVDAEPMGDGVRFTLHGGLVTSIVLDRAGRPTLLEGRTAMRSAASREWRLVVDGFAKAEGDVGVLPEKITLSLEGGEKGVLRIKSRELKVRSWPAEATDLELPEDAERRRLD